MKIKNHCKYYFLLLSLLLISCIGAQVESNKYSIQIGFGYNNYDLSSLKKFTNYYAGQLALNHPYLPVRVVDQFPNYISMQGEILFPFRERQSIGLLFGTGSSGARINYQDYSGELNTDLIILRYTFGLVFDWSLYTFGQNKDIIFRLIPVLILNELKVEEFVRIGEESVSETTKFKCTSGGVNFQLAFKYTLQRVHFLPYIGILVDVPRVLHLSEYPDAEFKYENEKVTVRWGSYQLGIFIGFSL
jgi:hypothetical protein